MADRKDESTYPTGATEPEGASRVGNPGPGGATENRLRDDLGAGPDGSDPALAPTRDEPPGDRGTSDRLRSEIDSGRTGDKVGYPDPAMAPLGTDDEAAGAPPTRDEIATARRQETGRVDAPTADPGRPVAHDPGRRPQPDVDYGRSTAQPAGTGRNKWLMPLIAAVVILLIIWMIL